MNVANPTNSIATSATSAAGARELPVPMNPSPGQQPIELVVQFRQPFSNPFGATNRVGVLSLDHIYAGKETLGETAKLAGALARNDAELAAHAVLRAPGGELLVTRLEDRAGSAITFEEDMGTWTAREWYSPLSGMLLAVIGAGENVSYYTDRGKEQWRAER